MSSGAATPTLAEQFERELEIFRTGAESVIQFLYACLAIHDNLMCAHDGHDSASKSADEVGRILGISVRAMNFHIAGALVKFNVANRTQAVTTAMTLGMLY